MNKSNIFNRSKALALHITTGGVIGFVAWGHPEFTWVAALMPALWSRAESRTYAWLLVLAYQLAGSRVIPQGAGVFFGDAAGLASGFLLWTAAALANTLPWAALWLPHQAKKRHLLMPLAAICCLLLGMLPPLGIIGWLNPLIATATLFPGYGFIAIASATLIIAGTVAFAPRWSAKGWISFAATVGILGVVTYSPAPKKPDFEAWAAIETKLGPYPRNFKEEFIRKRFVAETSEKRISAGASVVIFPEQILGKWTDLGTGTFLTTMFAETIPDDNTVLIGAERELNHPGHYANSLFIYSNRKWQTVDARQTVPFSMWKPWDKATFPADWTRINVIDVGGKRVAVSICYEDFLAPLHLMAFFMDAPEAIVSVSNSWWTLGTDEIAIQYQHIDAIARIFGVPLISAKNVG